MCKEGGPMEKHMMMMMPPLFSRYPGIPALGSSMIYSISISERLTDFYMKCFLKCDMNRFNVFFQDTLKFKKHIGT